MEAVIVKDIHVIRGKRVLLDFQLAVIYQVETRRLNEQVRRNLSRFPEDFIFQLTEEEMKILGLSKKGSLSFLESGQIQRGFGLENQ